MIGADALSAGAGSGVVVAVARAGPTGLAFASTRMLPQAGHRPATGPAMSPQQRRRPVDVNAASAQHALTTRQKSRGARPRPSPHASAPPGQAGSCRCAHFCMYALRAGKIGSAANSGGKIMMNRFWVWLSAAVLGGAACATVAGCVADEPSPATCPEENLVRGVCAGVPAGDACVGESRFQRIGCTNVVEVGSDDALTKAAQGASPGTCIALGPGRYGVVSVPGGVSLLGRSAAAVEIEGIEIERIESEGTELEAGKGTVLRGLTVGSGGVDVKGATGVRIESVRVAGREGDTRNGVQLHEGSSVTIVDSEIVDSGSVGVLAVGADVAVERSVISGAQRGGIVIEREEACDEDSCPCTDRPDLKVTSSVIRRNRVIGISLRGAIASLEDVDVIDTNVGAAVLTGQYGGGISAAECSDVRLARAVRVLGSRFFGILVDRSMAALGVEEEANSIEISGNTLGLWIQNTTNQGDCHHHGRDCSVTLHNGTLDGNFGVGIGVAGGSKGIILCKSAVTDTVLDSLSMINPDDPVQTFGDGVEWLDDSEVYIDGLTLSGNARKGLLIDGPAKGHIEALHFAGDADEPVQQNFTEGERPTGVALRTTSENEFPVPSSRPEPE
ncbi:right-handed parallel beta-helix repeat-containing protein [Sorangium sp. So ce134]